MRDATEVKGTGSIKAPLSIDGIRRQGARGRAEALSDDGKRHRASRERGRHSVLMRDATEVKGTGSIIAPLSIDGIRGRGARGERRDIWRQGAGQNVLWLSTESPIEISVSVMCAR